MRLRRKQVSKRRWITRFKRGDAIPYMAIVEYGDKLLKRLTPRKALIHLDAVQRDAQLCDRTRCNVMSVVSVEYLSDSYGPCDSCGTSYAEGARIIVDGKVVRELTPVAHCYNGQSYGDEDILRAILEHFGHELAGAPVTTENR